MNIYNCVASISTTKHSLQLCREKIGEGVVQGPPELREPSALQGCIRDGCYAAGCSRVWYGQTVQQRRRKHWSTCLPHWPTTHPLRCWAARLPVSLRQYSP